MNSRPADEGAILPETIKPLQKPCFSAKKGARGFLTSLAIAYAILDTIQMTEGLKKQSVGLKYASTGFYLIAASGFNTRLTFSSIDDIWQIIIKKKLPDEWPTLKNKRKFIAIALALATISYVAFTDACQGYNFGNDIPKLYRFDKYLPEGSAEFISGCVGFLTSAGVLLNEAIPTVALYYRFFSTTPINTTDPFRKYVSSPIATLTALANGISDGLITSFTLKKLFKLQSIPAIALLGGLGSLNCISDMAMNNSFIYDSMNQLRDYLATTTPGMTEIISMILALASGGLLGYAWHENMEGSLAEIPTHFNFTATNVTDPVIAGFSWTSGIATFLIYASTFYYLYFPVVNRIIKNCCQDSPTVEPVTENTHLLSKEKTEINSGIDTGTETASLFEDQETLDVQNPYATNPNILFPPPVATAKPEPKPTRSCTIL